MSGFKDECGVFGIFGHPEAAGVTYLGLYALQHRGQEAAGIVTSGTEKGFQSRKARGYVNEVFDADSLAKLGGPNAIGHTRYSTAGANTEENIQPLAIDCKFGEIAVCQPFLERQIELLAPALILFVGGIAARALLERADGVTRLRGQRYTYRPPGGAAPIPALVTFHPAYLLRSPLNKRFAWRDLLTLNAWLAELGNPHRH